MKTWKVIVSVIGAIALLSGAAFADPRLSLDTLAEWQNAMSSGRITPVSQWDPSFESHYPGRELDLSTSTLSVRNGWDIPNYYHEERPGLVMEWGEQGLNENDAYIGAWKYTYGVDPDLTGMLISIGVFPPARIRSISLGLIDENGRIKSWDWSVGPNGALQPNQQVYLSINPMLGAGQAGATSFFQDPLFNLTKVTGLVFDEDGVWLNLDYPSPLGNNKPWNYWKDLRVGDVPEPGSILVLSGGLAGLASLMRRKLQR